MPLRQEASLSDSYSRAISRSQLALLTALFDEVFYQRQLGHASADKVELVRHYLWFGWRKGISPSPTFPAARYLNSNPGLRKSDQNPFVHYLFETVGEAALDRAFGHLTATQIESLRANFDGSWYHHCYPEVETGGHDTFIHYMVSGWQDSRDASQRFSTKAYLERYPDVVASGIHPFEHWVYHGLAEGRIGTGDPLLPLSSWESLSASQQSALNGILDIDYYRSKFAGLGLDGEYRIAKYVSSGLPGSMDPGPSFRASRYVATHPEIVASQQVPILHFLFVKVGEVALAEAFAGLTNANVEAICRHFDTLWYLHRYPDVEQSGMDAFIHYMVFGWREGRNPAPDFSTRVYLLRYPDIAECGLNPFQHWVLNGKAEGRTGVSSSTTFRTRPYSPSITAILINSVSKPLSLECLTSVLGQSHGDLNFLIVGSLLDEASQAALSAFGRANGKKEIKFLERETSHLQWSLLGRELGGIGSDLLWFVQGDGVYDVEFLDRMASSFADGSVQLGFGRTLGPDDVDPTSENRLLLESEGWRQHLTSPAPWWFADNLTGEALAADQTSFLWRRRELPANVWLEADQYRYLGLWHLYLHMAAGGQIASVRDALVRSSCDAASTSNMLSHRTFYKEVERFAAEVQSVWKLPRATLKARNIELARAYACHMPSQQIDPFDTLFDVDHLSSIDLVKRHILIVSHGIFPGGAENFPLQMANELYARGFIVSMLIFKTDDVYPEMRNTLNPGVSIYEADWVLEYGCDTFLADIGCTIVHSHGVVSEMFFFGRCNCALNVPYVATLHGSYEASTSEELPKKMIAEIARRVDLFVYTADKNLSPLVGYGIQESRFVKMINAMPIDPMPFPQSRRELGIAEDAVVFTLVARGIKEKGWSTAIAAFKDVQSRHPERTMHLCLVGEGDEPDRLKPIHADDTTISFLGFQLRIHGLYRLSDVAIVPTRFAGESFPLCIIQALQVEVPVIATDVGEIASMLQADGIEGGIVVKNDWKDKVYNARFADAMDEIMDDDRRKQLGLGGKTLGSAYDMGTLTDTYVELYEKVSRNFRVNRPIELAK